MTLPVLHATGAQNAAWLLLALPLLGAAILLLGGKRTNSWGHLLGVAMPVASFVYAVIAFFQMLGYSSADRVRELTVYQFIDVGRFQIPLGLRLDQLSICFVLLITGVGSLIHIFAVGYMSHDPERRRFFGYMNLFLAAMLLLVLGSNYLVLYAGWEGVGLASYLLIGFWQYKPAAAVAAKKAFIANRVGDVGLSLAIMLMFQQFGTTNFTGVDGAVRHSSSGVVLAIGLLLLLGACGKSAQVPLQSWLLDAMEGPTPVSALIHAATMVTAGVYLIVRSAPIFDLSAGAQLRGRDRRRGDAAVRRHHRLREGRHQEGAGRIDDEPDRLHDAGGRARAGRVRARDRAPAGPRLLQGRPVPRRRLGQARDGRRGRHAPVRRPGQGHADHDGHVRARLPGDHRHPAVLRLLHQGPDHRRRLRQGRHVRRPAGHGRADRRRHHRVLHDQGHVHDLRRRAPLG